MMIARYNHALNQAMIWRRKREKRKNAHNKTTMRSRPLFSRLPPCQLLDNAADKEAKAYTDALQRAVGEQWLTFG